MGVCLLSRKVFGVGACRHCWTVLALMCLRPSVAVCEFRPGRMRQAAWPAAMQASSLSHTLTRTMHPPEQHRGCCLAHTLLLWCCIIIRATPAAPHLLSRQHCYAVSPPHPGFGPICNNACVLAVVRCGGCNGTVFRSLLSWFLFDPSTVSTSSRARAVFEPAVDLLPVPN